jgi:nuclear GTP-binding protein
MASESTLSSLAQLAESALADNISFVSSDLMSAAANKTKEQQQRYLICVLHKVVDEADVILVLDARDPAGCRSRLVVEEEVRRHEVDGHYLVFLPNKIGA